MGFVYCGRVAWKFGDFFHGDLILGRRGVCDINRDPENLKKYILTDYNPEFPRQFRKGDLFVAGRAFGGSRDHGAVRAMKALGVSVVVAESFGRIIFRHAVSNAFPVIECKGIMEFANMEDELEVDLEEGMVRNLTSGRELRTTPTPEPQLQILEAGGMIPYLKNKLGA